MTAAVPLRVRPWRSFACCPIARRNPLPPASPIRRAAMPLPWTTSRPRLPSRWRCVGRVDGRNPRVRLGRNPRVRLGRSPRVRLGRPGRNPRAHVRLGRPGRSPRARARPDRRLVRRPLGPPLATAAPAASYATGWAWTTAIGNANCRPATAFGPVKTWSNPAAYRRPTSRYFPNNKRQELGSCLFYDAFLG